MIEDVHGLLHNDLEDVTRLDLHRALNGGCGCAPPPHLLGNHANVIGDLPEIALLENGGEFLHAGAERDEARLDKGNAELLDALINVREAYNAMSGTQGPSDQPTGLKVLEIGLLVSNAGADVLPRKIELSVGSARALTYVCTEAIAEAEQELCSVLHVECAREGDEGEGDQRNEQESAHAGRRLTKVTLFPNSCIIHSHPTPRDRKVRYLLMYEMDTVHDGYVGTCV